MASRAGERGSSPRFSDLADGELFDGPGRGEDATTGAADAPDTGDLGGDFGGGVF